MTFQDFQKTRRNLPAYAFGDLIQSGEWEGETERRFLVYQDRYWIEDLEDGSHYLRIKGVHWITGEDISLEDLERKLYEHAVAT